MIKLLQLQARLECNHDGRQYPRLRRLSHPARPRSFVDSSKKISLSFRRAFHDVCCWVPDPLATGVSSRIKSSIKRLKIVFFQRYDTPPNPFSSSVKPCSSLTAVASKSKRSLI